MLKVTCGSEISLPGKSDNPGTGGCLVRFPDLPERLLMLTAAHVVVGTTARQFDRVEAKDLQGRSFGVLLSWTGIAGGVTTDAALVQVDPDLVVADIGPLGPPTGTNLDPRAGQSLRVHALGQTVRGTILDTNASRTINVIGPDYTAQVTYQGQILCEKFTNDGASGAVALDESGRVVGLVVAAGDDFTLVTPIDAVLNNPAWQEMRLEVLSTVPPEARRPEIPHPAPPPPAISLPESSGASQEGSAVPPAITDAQIAWGRAVGLKFKHALLGVCMRIQVDPNFLMACMAFETGQSFRADKINPISGATGLIQFMPNTAKGLGTTTAALAGMTAVEQLAFVERYFLPHTGKLNTLSDVYMAILFPKAIGKPESFVLFALPSLAYQENKGLDSNNDGQVTKAEAASRPQQMLITGLAKANLA